MRKLTILWQTGSSDMISKLNRSSQLYYTNVIIEGEQIKFRVMFGRFNFSLNGVGFRQDISVVFAKNYSQVLGIESATGKICFKKSFISS